MILKHYRNMKCPFSNLHSLATIKENFRGPTKQLKALFLTLYLCSTIPRHFRFPFLQTIHLQVSPWPYHFIKHCFSTVTLVPSNSWGFKFETPYKHIDPLSAKGRINSSLQVRFIFYWVLTYMIREYMNSTPQNMLLQCLYNKVSKMSKFGQDY